ncbi:MAG: transglutaminase-like domain-containing protein, partial [Balneolaceae bacterium]
RRKNNLDEVVRGAKNETELILKLNNWAASRWDWHMPTADAPDVVQWNGDQIMTPGETGEIGGYCLLFSVVLAQACQSFGIPARIVNLNYAIFGGHEVAEVWSRDYEKWFMVDPNFDSIFVSKETGEPMSVLELHEVFLKTYYPDGEVVDRDAWSDEERDRRGAMADPDEIPIRFRTDGYALSGKIDNNYIWWRVTEEAPAPGYNGGYGMFNTAYVRWVPRSNWLSQPYPTPVTHGRTHWGWDGYLAWTDEQTPRTQEHRHFLRKESDIYDRLCTVDYAAESGRDGSIQVHLATETPGFSHFEVISNGGQPVTTRSHAFQWELSTGVNRLEMRSVDVLGNRGPASELIVNYMPA